MPDKKGALTFQERKFVAAMAASGSAVHAAAAAGYRSTASASVKARDPRIIAAVEAERVAQLADKIMPLAIQAHAELLDKATPPATRRAAVQMAYDEWHKLAGDEGEGKDPHEMTADELARRIELLEVVKAAKAVDVTSPDPFA